MAFIHDADCGCERCHAAVLSLRKLESIEANEAETCALLRQILAELKNTAALLAELLQVEYGFTSKSRAGKKGKAA